MMDASDRAKRILSGMASYVEWPFLKNELQGVADILPSDTLGIYVNALDRRDFLIIGRDDLGISKCGKLEYIRYDEVASIKSPAKDLEPTIFINMKDGTLKRLSVLHGKEQVKDVYEFARFLMRSVEDTQRPKAAAP